ncbi:MAG: hypothetical protein RL026_909 [Pseudomonadota bacterium]|jgi:hypothetical protein
MAERRYPALQLHRVPWTDLTMAQVDAALPATASGPNASAPTDMLSGRRLRIVTDGGPTLDYHFRSARELALGENGGRPVKAGYAATMDRGLVLLSHMLPGTQRGWSLVIDLHTQQVTAFELAFCAYEAAENAAAAEAKRAPQFKNGRRHREVQRKVWFGYVEQPGVAAPTARHGWTNRMEGKGFHWTLEGGAEVLEFHLSILYSNFIELTRQGGEMTYCAPTDHIMVNDHQFICARVEAEFSGAFVLQVVDLFGMTLQGLRLGFDDQDRLEYHLYGGRGSVTGQIASFEVFGNNGDTRGPRRVYRPLETFETMTDAQVREAVLDKAHAFGDGQGSGAAGMGGYKSELATRFIGKSLQVTTENGGPQIEYEFLELRKLRWRHAGDAQWREAWYEMYEPDDQLYFFAHLLDAEWPRACAMVALDMKNGLATVVKGTTGNAFRNNETSVSYHFGTFRTEGSPTPPRFLRHGWTDEMVGECVTWNYQRGNPGLTSMHFYATPSSYSWIIFQPDGSGGMQWSSPGWYSKLRDGVYLMAWIEEACNGTLGVICFNQRTMHDAGFGYHVGSRGLSLNVIGARARHAGRFDIAHHLGLKA